MSLAFPRSRREQMRLEDGGPGMSGGGHGGQRGSHHRPSQTEVRTIRCHSNCSGKRLRNFKQKKDMRISSDLYFLNITGFV